MASPVDGAPRTGRILRATSIASWPPLQRAGVGKTAIVEGVAQMIAEPEAAPRGWGAFGGGAVPLERRQREINPARSSLET
jgi:hypothetical protein